MNLSEKVLEKFTFYDLFLFSSHLQLTLCLLNLVSLALCSTTAVSDESRKTSVRSASASVGTSAHLNSLNSLNSLQSSQDSGGKQQSVQQQTSTGHTSNAYRVPEYTSITQPHNAVYSQQPTAPTGGYFISVNPQGVPQAALGPGTNHVIFNSRFSSNIKINYFRSICPQQVQRQSSCSTYHIMLNKAPFSISN